MDVNLTGNNLTLNQLYQIVSQKITAFQPTSNASPSRMEKQYIQGELYHDEISMMALVLLSNAALLSPILTPDTKNQLRSALDQGKIPLIHVNHYDEASAMAELLESTSVVPEQEEEHTYLCSLGCISLAQAAFVFRKGLMLAETADLCVAMNLEAIRGETAAFDNRLHQLARPFPGQIDAAATVRRFVQGSEFTTDKARKQYGYDTGPRCQDAICIRAAPQTHGGVRDSLTHLQEVLTPQLNAVRSEANHILSHAVEHVTTALADLGNISERRSFRLLDSHLSYGLPDNLVYEAPGYNHGMAVVQEAATALLGELKLMALPAAACGDMHQTAVAGMQYLSGKKGVRLLPFLEKLLAVELLMVAQGMDLVQRELPTYSFGKGTSAVFVRYRKDVAVTKANRYLIDDLNTTHKLIADGTLLETAKEATPV